MVAPAIMNQMRASARRAQQEARRLAAIRTNYGSEEKMEERIAQRNYVESLDAQGNRRQKIEPLPSIPADASPEERRRLANERFLRSETQAIARQRAERELEARMVDVPDNRLREETMTQADNPAVPQRTDLSFGDMAVTEQPARQPIQSAPVATQTAQVNPQSSNGLQFTQTQGQADPSRGNAATANNVVQMLMQEAQRRGLTWFTPNHALGMAANFMQETGNFRADVIDFSVRGDNGTAHGLMQWRGPRFRNLVTYAQQNGMDPRDLRSQIMFAFEEGVGDTRYRDSGSSLAFQEMARARDAQEAAIAFIHAERPAGYTRNNPAGTHDTRSRLNWLNRAAQSIQSQEGSEWQPRTFDDVYQQPVAESDQAYSPAEMRNFGVGQRNPFSFSTDQENRDTNAFGTSVSQGDFSGSDGVDRILNSSRDFANRTVYGNRQQNPFGANPTNNPFDYRTALGVR